MAELILKAISSSGDRTSDRIGGSFGLVGAVLRGLLVAVVVVAAMAFTALIFCVSWAVGGWGDDRRRRNAAREPAQQRAVRSDLSFRPLPDQAERRCEAEATERFRQRLKNRLVARGRLTEIDAIPAERLIVLNDGGDFETLASLRSAAANRNGA